MPTTRTCSHVHDDGRPCAATPMRTGSLCFWHAPDKADEAAEARRLGGLRRRRERTISAAYDVAGLDSVAAVRRVLEIVVLDTLGLENSVARSRVLMGAVGIGTRLLEAEREELLGWEVD